MENRTVRHSRAKSEAESGIAEPPMAVVDNPVSIYHIIASVLAAHSSIVYLPEGEVLPPVEFGRSHVCRTVGFS